MSKEKGYIEFVFIREWTDLDWHWDIGDEISLSETKVQETRDRIAKYGESCDLVPYGVHSIPLTFLIEKEVI